MTASATPPDVRRDFCAVDFETYYDSKYSLKEMSTWEYVYHPKSHAYLVSVYHPDYVYVGPPSKCDWNFLTGKTLVMHNASFDGLVMTRLNELGVIPESCAPAGLFDTADLAAWLKVRRNLAAATRFLLKRSASKVMRDRMKGLTYQQAAEQGLEKELLEYGSSDAKNSYDIAVQYESAWPEDEQLISTLNREAGWRGIHVNIPKLESAIQQVETVVWQAGQKIPWEWDPDKTPLSLDKARIECRKCGIPAPSSFAKADEECVEWEDTYAKSHAWIRALRDYRRANMFLQKLKTIRRRLRPDGTIAYQNKYFGAHTGRFTAEEGFNNLNLERDPKVFVLDDGTVVSVDMRSLFIPPPGMKFLLADLNQIEPRVLALLSGDTEFLKACLTASPYEVHAVQTMGWTGPSLVESKEAGDEYAKKVYSTAKGRVLALGYQAGFKKFIVMLRIYGIDPYALFTEEPSPDEILMFKDWLVRANKEADLHEYEKLDAATQRVWVCAWLQVMDYRAKNPLQCNLWRRMDFGLKTSLNHHETFEVQVPSGRSMYYFDPVMQDGRVMARVERGGDHKVFYGGKITENITQAVARDIFVAGWCRLHRAGVRVHWTVYDEYVMCVPDAITKEDQDRIREVIREVPNWATGLPVDVSLKLDDCYLK